VNSNKGYSSRSRGHVQIRTEQIRSRVRLVASFRRSPIRRLSHLTRRRSAPMTKAGTGAKAGAVQPSKNVERVQDMPNRRLAKEVMEPGGGRETPCAARTWQRQHDGYRSKAETDPGACSPPQGYVESPPAPPAGTGPRGKVVKADIRAAPDLLSDMPSFIRRVCSGFAPMWGVLRTQLV
jgi:hypothetical protein